MTDLTTGEVLQTQSFQSKPGEAKYGRNGQPEYPPVDEVKDIAMRGARSAGPQRVFPWIEYKQEVFYDDKECGLKEAYELLKRGDHDGALQMTQSSLEQCKGEHEKREDIAEGVLRRRISGMHASRLR